VTRVKICGLTEPRDAALALDLGATHLGCVCAADSPRSASPHARVAIRELARGRAAFVLVARGVDLDTLCRLAAGCEPDLVQWHGASARDEEEAATRLPLLRVRQVGPGGGLPALAGAGPRTPFVLDGGRGGAGRTFDWSLLGSTAPEHVFVAGGITPANVADLLAFAPWGIDVSSGIERAPGQKDPAALRALFEVLEVKR